MGWGGREDHEVFHVNTRERRLFVPDVAGWRMVREV